MCNLEKTYLKAGFMDKYMMIRGIFEDNSDSVQADAMSKYMRGKFRYYGIPTPLRRKLYKSFLKEERKKEVVDWDFIDKCYEDDHREFQYCAYDYLLALNSSLTYDDLPKILELIRSKQWWDTIDFLDKAAGNIGLRDSRADTVMLEWSQDSDIWVRRAAIGHQLGRKEKTDTQLLEKILVNNFGSDEFFINKAIGWALRDYSKTDPGWIRGFIAEYGAEMDKLSISEASKYI